MQAKRPVTRRRVLGFVGAVGLGSVGVAALAACGEPQVIEKIVTQTVEKIVTVPVEKIVTVEVERAVEKTVAVPVEKIVTVEVERVVEKIVTVEVEKIVEVPVEKIVEKVVEKEVPVTTAEPTPAREPVELRFATDHTSGPRGCAMQWRLSRLAELRPDIFVNLEPTDSLIDTFADHLIEGTAPHVQLLHQSDFLYFHDFGAFTEITDLLPKLDVIKEDYYFIPDSYTLTASTTRCHSPGL